MPIEGVGGTEVEATRSAFALVCATGEHRVARVGFSHIHPFLELLVFLYLGGCEITRGREVKVLGYRWVSGRPTTAPATG